MVCFAVKTDRDARVFKFVDQARENFKGNSKAQFFINSFEVKVFKGNSSFFMVFDIVLGPPPIYLLGFVFLALAFLWRPFFFISLPFLLAWFFFSRLWFFIVISFALKKQGYKGPVKLLGDGPALRGVSFGSG